MSPCLPPPPQQQQHQQQHSFNHLCHAVHVCDLYLFHCGLQCAATFAAAGRVACASTTADAGSQCDGTPVPEDAAVNAKGRYAGMSLGAPSSELQG